MLKYEDNSQIVERAREEPSLSEGKSPAFQYVADLLISFHMETYVSHSIRPTRRTLLKKAVYMTPVVLSLSEALSCCVLGIFCLVSILLFYCPIEGKPGLRYRLQLGARFVAKDLARRSKIALCPLHESSC